MKSNSKRWSFFGGMFVVVGTHLYLLFSGLPSDQIVPHAILNLLASGLLYYSWLD
jgi:hypothetical protein